MCSSHFRGPLEAALCTAAVSTASWCAYCWPHCLPVVAALRVFVRAYCRSSVVYIDFRPLCINRLSPQLARKPGISLRFAADRRKDSSAMTIERFRASDAGISSLELNWKPVLPISALSWLRASAPHRMSRVIGANIEVWPLAGSGAGCGAPAQIVGACGRSGSGWSHSRDASSKRTRQRHAGYAH